MPKTLPVSRDDKIVGYMIMCPACSEGHCFYNGNLDGKPHWTFDGNVEKPTFSPSMLVRGHRYPSGGKFPSDEEYKRMMDGEDLSSEMIPYVCHSFVKEGKIQFLNDCTHKLKGQTVELEDM